MYLYAVEHSEINTIMADLQVSYSTVLGALANAGVELRGAPSEAGQERP